MILLFTLGASRTSKNTVTKYSNFEHLYGSTDQKPFEFNTTFPISNVQGNKEELPIKKFTNHYKWIIDAWETKRE